MDNKLKYEDKIACEFNQKQQKNEMNRKNYLRQMEQKYQRDQLDADNDVAVGERMNRTLQENDALASLYPQLKVTPMDQAFDLKRKQ